MRSYLYVLLFVTAGLVVALAPLPVQPTSPQARTFRIEARQFAYSPSELKINPGDTVTIQLVSTDVVHGLYIDGYGISLQADPGQTATVTFVASKPGSFRFRCNVICGAMHPFMIGKFTVGSQDWLYRSIGLAVVGTIGFLPPFGFAQGRLSSFFALKKKKEERVALEINGSACFASNLPIILYQEYAEKPRAQLVVLTGMLT